MTNSCRIYTFIPLDKVQEENWEKVKKLNISSCILSVLVD